MSTGACFSCTDGCGFCSVGAGRNAGMIAGATVLLLAGITTGGFFSGMGACGFVWEMGGEFRARCCTFGLDFDKAGRNIAKIKHAAAALSPP